MTPPVGTTLLRSPCARQSAHPTGTATTSVRTGDTAKVAIAEHSAGNHRSMMTHCDELFAAMLDRNATTIDGDLFFDHYKPRSPPKRKR